MSGRADIQVVPMHAEAVVGDARTVRWVLPPGTVPFAGPVRDAPRPLADLVDAGVIRRITCESCALRIELAGGQDWRQVQAQVRDAIAESLGDGGWAPYDEQQRGPDALLRAAVQEVLAGPAGDYVRSHGGAVTVASVTGGRVEVTFEGTCGHCPATGITLHDRLETDVRRRHPALHSITATNSGAGRGPLLLRIRRRRDS